MIPNDLLNKHMISLYSSLLLYACILEYNDSYKMISWSEML